MGHSRWFVILFVALPASPARDQQLFSGGVTIPWPYYHR